VAKVALRFGCAKQSKNLKRYLLSRAFQSTFITVQAIPKQVTIPLNKSLPGIKALQNERNENIELRQENVDLTQDKKRLNNLLEEKDRNNAQLKSELKDIKSYLRQIREGTKKFL
jgi:cell shape-determining protein MreC